jgi:hypothetical protein
MLLSAYNLFGGAVNEAFLRIKPLATWTGGFSSPIFGITHAAIMLAFTVLIVLYATTSAVHGKLRSRSAAVAALEQR